MNLDKDLRRRLKLAESAALILPLWSRVIAANVVLFVIVLILAGLLKP